MKFKNKEHFVEEFTKSIKDALIKAVPPSKNDLGPHHAKSIEAGLTLLGHKNHKVSDENPGNFSGLHVAFHDQDQDNHEDDISKVLAAHKINHGGTDQNDNEDEGHEHFIHPAK